MMSNNGTILLVEDSHDEVLLTTEALREQKIKNPIFVVSDGSEALEYLFCEGRYSDRDINQKPSLVLLDLNLPKVGGVEVLRKIRKNPATQCLIVVIFTTSNEQKDMIESYRLGVNSYLHKPIDFDDFNQVIKDIGMYWLLLNEHPYK